MSLLLMLLVGAPLALKGPSPGSPETRRYVAELADCVVKSAPRKSKKIVLGELPLRREDENFRLVIRQCIPPVGNGNWTVFGSYDIIMRFQLAEAFLRKEPMLTLPPLQSVAPLTHNAPQREELPANIKLFDAALSRLGECIVRGAPGAAAQLIRSKIGSAEEDRAFAAIKPALSACLDAGRTFTLSAEVVRGSVALNFYRLAKAPQARFEATK